MPPSASPARSAATAAALGPGSAEISPDEQTARPRPDPAHEAEQTEAPQPRPEKATKQYIIVF